MRSLGSLFLCSSLAFTAACSGSKKGTPDAGSQDPQSPGEEDEGSINTAAERTLALTTEVSIDAVDSPEQTWLVIYADDGSGRPDLLRPLGHAPIPKDGQEDVKVGLSERLTDKQQLHAVLHEDFGTPGVFEPPPGADVPVRDKGKNLISASFVVNVGSKIADVQLNLSPSSDANGFIWAGTEPSTFAASVLGSGATNNALNLKTGWRYRIVNPVLGGDHPHPFEIVSNPNGGSDEVLLSQKVDGSLEADGTLAWVETTNGAEGTVVFAVNSDPLGNFPSSGVLYRSANEPTTLRGAINVVP